MKVLQPDRTEYNTRESQLIEVKDCQYCGQDHSLAFEPIVTYVMNPQYTHKATCPNTEEKLYRKL